MNTHSNVTITHSNFNGASQWTFNQPIAVSKVRVYLWVVYGLKFSRQTSHQSTTGACTQGSHFKLQLMI